MKDLEKDIQLTVDLFNLRKYTEAQIKAEKLILKNPKIVFLYNILGLILTEKKEIDDAIKIFQKGISINSNHAMIYNNLGTAYKLKDDYINSEKCYKKSISIDRNVPETHNNLGNLYIYLNQHNKGINSYKHSVLINKNFFVGHYNLGLAYKSIGKFLEAKKHLTESTKLNPNFFTSHRILSQVIKYSNNEKHFDILKDIYNKEKKGNKRIDEIAFALGKAYEDVQDYDNAFKYYNIGNNIKRSNINFSIKDEKENFISIKKIFNKNIYSNFKDVGSKNSSVIFIVGMPRSGTTLVEQIVSNHSKVYGADELNILPELVKKYFCNLHTETLIPSLDKFKRDDFKKIGEEYIYKLNKITSNETITTDKLTVNFKWIGLIKLILPNAKIINCSRNKQDTCFSIFKNYFTSNELTFAYEINEIVSYYNLYCDLMNHWNSSIPNFVYDIKYENLIKKPEINIKKLLNFCSLDWDENCLKFYNNKRAIKTASDTQVRSKLYSSSIDYWKKFEKYINKPFVKFKN
jgi:tetratricopeptide (TPR) repeat protein